MHYTIIIGSSRQDSQSGKVGKYVEHVLKKFPETMTIDIIDLKGHPLPFWDECMWTQQPAELYEPRIQIWKPMQEKLKNSDGIIVISPERSGTVPGELKNLFLYMSPDIVGNKPALLIGVSDSRGGAYPIAELRMSSYKNTQICYIPQHVIVRNVKEVLNSLVVDEAVDSKEDSYIKNRITYSLLMLEQYSKALKLVRKSNVMDLENYKNGM